MKHLLLTRFQGGLMGGNIIYLSQRQIAPNQLFLDSTPAMMGGIDSLIRCGGFNLEDWLQSTSSVEDVPGRSIIAMVPLMLFFHEDRPKLRQIIIDISRSQKLDWETCSSAIAIGYIISRSISETCEPREIIPQLLDEMTNLHPLLFQQLSEIDRLLAQPSSLQQTLQKLTITTHLTLTPTTLAIYCFLSTPEDFSLAIRCAHQIPHQTQLTCALTGILAGVHNSSTGIPLNGLLATQQRLQWITTSENLLNLWAGVYQIPGGASAEEHRFPIPYTLPIAAPKVIQRRD